MALDGDIKFSAFKGSAMEAQHEERTLVRALNYEVARQVVSSERRERFSGRQEHGLVSVTCHIDRAMPLAWHHLVQSQVIEEVEIRLFRTRADGIAAPYLTLTLADVMIASVELTQLHNQVDNSANLATEAMVQYRLAYQEITVTYDDGSGAVEAHDSRS